MCDEMNGCESNGRYDLRPRRIQEYSSPSHDGCNGNNSDDHDEGDQSKLGFDVSIAPCKQSELTLWKAFSSPEKRGPNSEVIDDPYEEDVVSKLLSKGKIADDQLDDHIEILKNIAQNFDETQAPVAAVPDLTDFDISLKDDESFSRPLLMSLKTKDPNFSPVDVVKGSKYTFVTSQATNVVAVFNENVFQGVLRKDSQTKLFKYPRNVTCAPLRDWKQNGNSIIVVDDSSFEVYDEATALPYKTFLKGKGCRYRGLGYYLCNGESHLVTLDVSNENREGVHVCILIEDDESPEKIKVVKRVKIPGSDSGSDPKCRFLTVVSDCTLTECKQHVAYVTGLCSKKIYAVNLITGESNIVTLERKMSHNLTFARPQQIQLQEPTGICTGDNDNLFVADRKASKIYKFTPNGVVSKEIALSSQPVGLHYDQDRDQLYVADGLNHHVAVYNVVE